MKRQKSKPQKRQRQSTPPPAPSASPAVKAQPRSRRDLLRDVRNYGLAAAIVFGGGGYLASDVYADFIEHDLTRIGDGVPTVVQIHDPNCGLCRELQRETREALRAFDADQLRYVVANTTTPEGRRLAQVHGVSHVTLLLFDGAGKRRQTLRGVAESAILEDAFRRHLNAEPAS